MGRLESLERSRKQVRAGNALRAEKIMVMSVSQLKCILLYLFKMKQNRSCWIKG